MTFLRVIEEKVGIILYEESNYFNFLKQKLRVTDE